MKAVCLFFACLLTLVSVSPSEAKEWRGIKPLDSTRADVKRLLGVPRQSSAHAFFYSLPDAIAVVRFQSGPCDDFGFGWNVPAGTVTGVGVIPKAKDVKEKFFDGLNFKLYHAGGGFELYTHENGMSVETFNGIVTSLDYTPTAQDEVRQCPRVQVCCVDRFPLFDEYNNLSFSDEKARLTNYVIEMKESMNRGVIIVYARTPTDRAQLMKRAARAQRYLTQKHGIEMHRILIVDGGYRSVAVISLNLHAIGGLTGPVYLFPEKGS